MFCLFIHGPVASGKLTIAKELQVLSGLPVHHNHYAVDAAISLFPFGSDAFKKVREQIWLSVFEQAAIAKQSFIFTFAPEASVRAELIDELVNTVRVHGGEIVFVELGCAQDEIERRLPLPSRSAYGKLNSVEVYRQLLTENKFLFSDLPEPLLSIATNELTAKEAAAAIYEKLHDIEN